MTKKLSKADYDFLMGRKAAGKAVPTFEFSNTLNAETATITMDSTWTPDNETEPTYYTSTVTFATQVPTNIGDATYTVTENVGKAAVNAYTLTINGLTKEAKGYGTATAKVKTSNSDAAVFDNHYTPVFNDSEAASFRVYKYETKDVNGTATGVPMAGVTFELYDGNTKVTDATTDEDGYATITIPAANLNKDTSPKNFTLKEKVPAGYVMDTAAQTWTVTATRPEANGDVSTDDVTVTEGEGVLNRVFNWIVTHILNGETDEISGTGCLNVENTPIDYTIKVMKVDMDGNALSGAAFELGGNAMEAVSRTADNNMFVASGVHYGENAPIKIEETTAPNGYTGVGSFYVKFTVDEETQIVDNLILVNEDGSEITNNKIAIQKISDTQYGITVKNEKNFTPPTGEREDRIVSTSFDILKTDEANEPLAGAIFKLTDASGNEVWSGTTGETGELEAAIGAAYLSNESTATRTFTLTEISPNGYTGKGPWTVEVTCEKTDELNGDHFRYVYTWSVASVKLDGVESAADLLNEGCLTVVNTRDLGALTIEKVIDGEYKTAGQNKTFQFTITGPADANGTYSIKDSQNTVTFTDGTATVSIVGENSVTIVDLPTGEYKVKEDTTSARVDGMNLSVSYLDTDKSESTEVKAVTNDGIVTVLKDVTDTKMTVTNTYTYVSDGPDEPYTPPKPITDPDVPKTDVPETPEEPGVDIPDEPTPTDEYTDPGATGDSSLAWIMAAAVSGIGLVWLSLSGKKRKDENAE